MRTGLYKNGITLYLVLVLSLVALGASAQHYVGVMGGWGGGSARFKPAKETGYEWGLYTGGLSYKFYSSEKYIGGIEIDLLFTQKGFNYDLAFESDESYHRKVNAIEVPLIWQPHFYMFQRRARFFINLGIQVSYNLNSTYSLVSKTAGVTESGKYTMQLNRDNRFGYGLCGGAGLAFLLGPQRRYEFSVEARYGFGFGDILRNVNKYKGNPERSPLDNINVFGAFYYRLGKEGIRAAAGKATEQRMEEQAARHMLRQLNKQLKKGELSADSVLVKSLLPDSVPSGPIPIDSATIETVRTYLKLSSEIPAAIVTPAPATGTEITLPGTKPGAMPENGTKSAKKTTDKPSIGTAPGTQPTPARSSTEGNNTTPTTGTTPIKSESHE